MKISQCSYKVEYGSCSCSWRYKKTCANQPLIKSYESYLSLCGTSLLQHLFLFLDIVVCCCMVLYILYDWHFDIYFALLQ